MLHHILANRQDEGKQARILPPSKRFKVILLVAVVTICLTTTAWAAAYMGLDDMFRNYLKPNSEQTQALSNGAYVVDKQIKNKNGTLEIKQVIGDHHLTYILMDFIAPEGTLLDAARYRFADYDLTTDQSYQSVEFEVVDDSHPSDNKISLVMSIFTKNSIAGQKVHFKVEDLQASDPYPGHFKTVIGGDWETELQLGFTEYSMLYEVNKKISMFGHEAILQSISISPISISLKIESSSMDVIHQAAGPLKEIGLNQNLDDYPITIKYQDGTSETTSLLNGIHLSESHRYLFTVKRFEHVINDKEISSIVFFDTEIAIR
ncbi:hypothetical protein PA598K_01236 [Paenibacillus sp. 598K]|nr:hypothetical protein PA598K_01236 [Paenibacillus sp. 598K]